MEKKLEKCFFPIFEWSLSAYNATKIASQQILLIDLPMSV